ncbi:serine/threonine-protein kinase BLUS1 [Impatiens glandulifera]|uniref:serine/threonine-protein kinase BLUS1 n=1 Tax=Impatiens glandulifera TaxID=253017 RepID=UPI001FB0CE2E|nr:serine/threonine-protein kinase BLUS1 [Impatiens glandulifera]
MEKKMYPIGPENYMLYEEVGQGVSASVFRALCLPLNEVVAIKILDFERDNCDLNNIFREAQTMILVDHPNVLKSNCSFVSDHNLWVVMPYMAGGSCLHILKAAYPDGFEEVVIATVLREVLKGLEYLHHHGHIHRDVKAGNVLIDSRGAIKLGDFGVSACLFDSGDRQRTRNTFVGTPCWMAPEVMEQLHGYDFKADIWSFGITALELAHGHAPFSKYPPMKVLLMTLQNAPPGLDLERDKKFSKSFKQMIASCLVKDQSKRPSAKKLLKHSFFKQARSNDYILRTLFEGLPALGDRIKAIKMKEEDMLAKKKIPDGQKEEMSQNEYKRGISGWNFNVEDVKAQASLILDDDIVSEASTNPQSGLDHEKKFQQQLSSISYSSQEENDQLQTQPPSVLSIGTLSKGDKSENETSIVSSSIEHHISRNSSPRTVDSVENVLTGKPGIDTINGRNWDMSTLAHRRRAGSMGSIMLPDFKDESERPQNHSMDMSSCNGLGAGDDMHPESLSRGSKTSANSDELDEKAKPVIQQKGRFKVTSESIDVEKASTSTMLPKSHSMQVIAQSPYLPLPSPSGTIFSNHLPVNNTPFPLLHSLLQTNILQQEQILTLMKRMTCGEHSGEGGFQAEKSIFCQLEASHEREKELLNEISDLQWKLSCVKEELLKYKTENGQV